MKSFRFIAIAGIFLGLCGVVNADGARISKERYLDKCKGAWAGQMIGVCYGAPYEFTSNGKPMTEPLQPWTPDRVEGSIGQDDCYVEMTFLKALEDYGLDVTNEQAGKAFADTKYELWHANKFGRENVRQGIMPPQSGSPEFNKHADDIDFQIESDLLGIVCPGLSKESNRLCDVFGHIMNYGDGVYGGMFVAGMYAASYFEDSDVLKVVNAGLECIPAESQYRKCMSDVVNWHNEAPSDWLATWKKIEDKWQDDIDCEPGQVFNIDAKLNGAYIVMGLLYGDGDFGKTIEIATRCGQDNDCNPSSAAGVLGCMKGYAALGDAWTAGIPKIADTKFQYTDYSFNTLIPTCQRITELIIARANGKVEGAEYVIPVQQPTPPEKLEQWVDREQEEALKTRITKREMAMWNYAWKLVQCGPDMSPGIRDEYAGKKNVLMIHPVDQKTPGSIDAELQIPSEGNPILSIETTSDANGDFVLKVFVKDKQVLDKLINGHGKWETVKVDLSEYRGGKVAVRIEDVPNDWHFEAAYFGKISVE
jgi:hypothetical protein